MSESNNVEPGIYFGMPAEQYHRIPALSNSGIKRLAISPLHYWHHHLNADRPEEEETSSQRFGTATHCRLLEPDRYADRYAPALDSDDFPGALDTVEDLKKWLAEHELPVSGKKQVLIDRVMVSGIPAVILDVQRQIHAEQHAGKIMLSKADARQLDRLAEVFSADPYAQSLLSGGVPEVSFVVRDPVADVLLKARMDYVRTNATIDLKTFSNSRGKPTDRAVFEAIYYEGYHVQCAFYHRVRELARELAAAGEIGVHGDVDPEWLKAFLANEHHGFGFIFIESCEPFDLRIVQMRRAEAPGADTNLYWDAAALKAEEMAALYAQCLEKYGAEPWREPMPPHVLADSDLPQLLFS